MCSCDDYDEAAEFFRYEEVKRSRRERLCCECQGTILVGATYYRASFKFDGEFSSVVICGPCETVRMELSAIEHERDPHCYCSAPYGWMKDEIIDGEMLERHGERLRPLVQHWPWALRRLEAPTP